MSTQIVAMSDVMTMSEAAVILGTSIATLRNRDRAGTSLAVRHLMTGYRQYSRCKSDAFINQLRQKLLQRPAEAAVF